MNITKRSALSLKKLAGVAAMGAAAVLFAACEENGDTGTFGAPDRFAEDPHEDAENPPPAPGTVDGADPRADSEGELPEDLQAEPQEDETGSPQ